MATREEFDPRKVALGKRIREARESRKITQERLAKYLNLKTKQAVSHWEVGRWAPEATLLPAIARQLHVSIDWLLGSSADPSRTRDPVKTIPHLNAAQLLAYATGKLNLANIEGRRPSLADGDDLISIEANRAMEKPDGGGIASHSSLTINTSRKPEPGEIVVVALLGTSELLIGRYRPAPTRKADEFTLRFDNLDFPERPVTKKDKARIIGTMVEVVSLQSR